MCLWGAGAQVGPHVVLNARAFGWGMTSCSQSTALLSPHCVVGGGCRFGKGVFMGSNATIIPQRSVGLRRERSRAGRGGCCTTCPGGALAVGNPAKAPRAVPRLRRKPPPMQHCHDPGPHDAIAHDAIVHDANRARAGGQRGGQGTTASVSTARWSSAGAQALAEPAPQRAGLFTEREPRVFASAFADPAPVYAGSWCAKEAVFKAVSRFGTLTLDQIEIERLATGCPWVHLPQAARAGRARAREHHSRYGNARVAFCRRGRGLARFALEAADAGS